MPTAAYISAGRAGEATASDIAALLRPAGICRHPTRSRHARAGGKLDHVDELTLYRVLHGRRNMA
ncbi:MAG: hypothetical protein ACKVY0_14260 [Prosthecobacter sp.]|uniref:hypothetical protein n=1 Tax=Prosthecobacter sp. TaxID=1965333 RepID=UPI0039036BBD